MTNQPATNRFELKVRNAQDGATLQSFISDQLNLSRRKAKELIDSRCVTVNRKRIWMCNHRLRTDDCIEVAEGAQMMPHQDLPVLFRDETCIIIDKPPGLLSDGINSAEQMLQKQLRNPRILAVHRLDRDTSGCLMFAEDPESKRALVPVFQGHSITKLYHVIVGGSFPPGETTCSDPVDGQHAVSHFRTLDSNREASHLQVRIETGRTHQIRKHLAVLGHYVLGDRFYGVKKKMSNRDMKIRRQMLHSSSLEFISPANGRRVRAKSQLPGDFRKTLKLFNLS